MISPVRLSYSTMRSISSPKKAMRKALVWPTGMISSVSPRTRNTPVDTSTSLRSYWMVTNWRSRVVRRKAWPTRRGTMYLRQASGEPSP